MKKMFVSSVLFSLGFALASESFGGLGLAIYAAEAGAEVAAVVDGSPAASVKLKTGDFLLSANGVPLAGRPLNFDMDILRGEPNEPVELSVLRGADTLSFSLRRESFEVEEISAEDLAPVQEMKSSMKNSPKEGFRFLDVVSVSSFAAKVFAKEQTGELSKERISREAPKTVSISVFNRGEIAFFLKEAGDTRLEIANVNGKVVASFAYPQANAGENRLIWDGSMLPSGSYVISVKSANKVNRFTGVLK